MVVRPTFFTLLFIAILPDFDSFQLSNFIIQLKGSQFLSGRARRPNARARRPKARARRPPIWTAYLNRMPDAASAPTALTASRKALDDYNL